jgi:uncharacterized protein (TIGR02996 family)
MLATDEAAFLAAILAAPDDDAPRLVYADWLRDHGQEERAEFIQVQCELARTSDHIETGDWCNGDVERIRNPKWDTLYKRQEELWYLPAKGFHPPLSGEEWEYSVGEPYTGQPGQKPLAFVRRGFIHSITCPAADWINHADKILATQPVREVRLTTPLLPGMDPPGGWKFSPMIPAGRLWSEGNHSRLYGQWPGIRFHQPDYGWQPGHRERAARLDGRAIILASTV